MGTRVQCKSYYSGYYHVKDVNGDATFSWSPFCEDKTFSGQLCNDLKLRRAGSWMDYNKEMLKQTMLEHEAIFQKQVYELHRLYQIQRELMHEHKKKKLNRFSGPLETSNSSMLQPRMLPELGQSIWHLPHRSLENSCQSKENFTCNDGNRASLNFLKESAMKCSPMSTKIGVVNDDIPVDSKLKKFPKRILDLHLPADAYIEDDVAGRTERENTTEACSVTAESCNPINGIGSGNDVKSTLSKVETPFLETCLLKSNLTDLNEPSKDLCEEGNLCSDSQNVHSEVLQQPQPKSNCLGRNLFIDQYRDGISLNNFGTNKVETGREWLPLHSDSVRSEIVAKPFSFSLIDEKYPMSSESIKLRLDLARDEDQKDTRLGEKTAHCSEFCGSLHFSSNHTSCAASKVTSPSTAASPFPYATATSPLNSSWRYQSKGINHLPTAVEALACFSGSLSNDKNKSYSVNKRSNSNDRDIVQRKGDLLPQMGFGNESSQANGFHHGFQMRSPLAGMHLSPSNLEKANLNTGSTSVPYESSDTNEAWKCTKDLQFVEGKTTKDLNLDQGTLGGTRMGFTEKYNITWKYDESSKGLTWSGEKLSHNGSAQRNSQLDFRIIKGDALTSKFLGEEVKDKSLFLNHSPVQVKERGIQDRILTDRLNGNGIVNPPDSCQSNIFSLKSASHDRQVVADELKGSGNEKAVRSPGLREDINLNSDLVPIDDKFFAVSETDETSCPSSICPTKIAGKLTRKLDLEAPADEMEEENTSSGVEIIVDVIPQVKPVEMFQEKISPQDYSMKLAADIMVSMSVDVHTNVETFTYCPVALSSSSDSLHLLAEVVMSNAETAEASKGTDEEDDDDGTDIFESMTLKLQELKVDEYFCKYSQPEKPMDDEKSMASLLLTRPRRVQRRKRRQKRDFQKDILPAIASLSRHEVTEDLQALGGATRATKSRQAAATRRSSSQNRSNPSGRRRPRSLAITITELDDRPPQVQQPIRAELENDGGSIMTWGRTTRRRRRQRMPPGTHSSVPRD